MYSKMPTEFFFQALDGQLFKRMPKERQLMGRHVHKILSLGIKFIKYDVNLKLRLSVGSNAI